MGTRAAWLEGPQWRPSQNISSMQKRANGAGLRLYPLERSAYEDGPWLAPGNLDLRGFPPFPGKSGSLGLNYVGKQYGLC